MSKKNWQPVVAGCFGPDVSILSYVHVYIREKGEFWIHSLRKVFVFLKRSWDLPSLTHVSLHQKK